MSKKLYVGNLPYSTNDEELKEHFTEMGEVEDAKVIMDKMSGRSRGFGFVTMTNDEEAETAIEKRNGVELEGRPLVVNEARPMTERPPKEDS
jgi:RNA recognition motif-containing protein